MTLTDQQNFTGECDHAVGHDGPCPVCRQHQEDIEAVRGLLPQSYIEAIAQRLARITPQQMANGHHPVSWSEGRALLADYDSLRSQVEALREAMEKFVNAYQGEKALRLGNGQARRSLDDFRALLESKQ